MNDVGRREIEPRSSDAHLSDKDGCDVVSVAHQQYEQSLLRYCHSLTRDIHQSQEVVQETFLKLTQQSEKPSGDHLQAWLFRVCRNQIIDQKRRQGKMTSNPLLEHDLPSQAESPETLVANVETQTQIMDLVACLPEKQREVLRLKFQNSMSYKQIAEVMGETVSNVGVTLHNAINKLRKKAGVSQG